MELELITNDAIRAMRAMPSESVHVCMTSPDYNLGVRYKSRKKVQQMHEYIDWAREWTTEIVRLLRPDGSFFLNIAGAPSRPLLPHYLVVELSKIAVLQNTFHWIKSISVKKDGEDISVGHFKPLSGSRYVNDLHEYVFHFTRTGNVKLNRKAIGVPYADKSNVKRWGHTEGADVRCRGNTWYVPYQTIQNRNKQRPHPATFPPELAHLTYLITDVNQNSVVLDPFVGIGNAGVAAKWMPAGKFIGIDIEPFYIEEATKRINN